MNVMAEYTIGEVASMLGFSPHTIRAWERRHNILKPQRTPSGQRRYSDEDVDLLREVINGVAVRGLSLKVAVRAAHGALSLQSSERGQPHPDSALPLSLAATEEVAVPWRAVADSMALLIAIIDEHGVIVDTNVALASASGRPREQLRGTRLTDLVDPYDRAKAVTAFRPPFQRRRGWELNLGLPGCEGVVSFDCIPIRCGLRPLLIVMGQDVKPPRED